MFFDSIICIGYKLEKQTKSIQKWKIVIYFLYGKIEIIMKYPFTKEQAIAKADFSKNMRRRYT